MERKWAILNSEQRRSGWRRTGITAAEWGLMRRNKTFNLRIATFDLDSKRYNIHGFSGIGVKTAAHNWKGVGRNFERATGTMMLNIAVRLRLCCLDVQMTSMLECLLFESSKSNHDQACH